MWVLHLGALIGFDKVTRKFDTGIKLPSDSLYLVDSIWSMRVLSVSNPVAHPDALLTNPKVTLVVHFWRKDKVSNAHFSPIDWSSST